MAESDDEPEVVPLLHTRRLVALATIGVGLCGFVSLFSSDVELEGWRAVVAYGLIGGCVPLSLLIGRSTLTADWWYTGRNPQRAKQVAAYILFGDLAYTLFLTVFNNHQAALFACVFFVLNSYFVGHFGTRSIVFAHCLLTSMVIAGLGYAMWDAGETDAAGALARVLVLLLVVNGATLGTHGFSLDVHQFAREHYAMASRDPLTGLLNRRGLQRAIELAPSVGERHVGVIVADIDHFKSVNDTHGHEAGDAVITQFAARLERVVAVGGIVARIGGDEFCVVLTDATPETVRRVADTLLAVGRCVDDDVPVTISVGATSASGGSADSVLADAFRRADDALYRAKRLGRGRVEFVVDVDER